MANQNQKKKEKFVNNKLDDIGTDMMSGVGVPKPLGKMALKSPFLPKNIIAPIARKAVASLLPNEAVSNDSGSKETLNDNPMSKGNPSSSNDSGLLSVLKKIQKIKRIVKIVMFAGAGGCFLFIFIMIMSLLGSIGVSAATMPRGCESIVLDGAVYSGNEYVAGVIEGYASGSVLGQEAIKALALVIRSNSILITENCQNAVTTATSYMPFITPSTSTIEVVQQVSEYSALIDVELIKITRFPGQTDLTVNDPPIYNSSADSYAVNFYESAASPAKPINVSAKREDDSLWLGRDLADEYGDNVGFSIIGAMALEEEYGYDFESILKFFFNDAVVSLGGINGDPLGYEGSISWSGYTLGQCKYTSSARQYTSAHKAWDLSAPVGSKIFAVGPGTVAEVCSYSANHVPYTNARGEFGCFLSGNGGSIAGSGQCHSSYGNAVIVNHGNGYFTLYAHMDATNSALRVGTQLYADTYLGTVGMTGCSNGPHIHMELRQGIGYNLLDPASLFAFPQKANEILCERVAN